MSAIIPYYYKSIDWDWLIREYPPPPSFHDTRGHLSAEALHALQEKRFLARVGEAWNIPFYRDRWHAAGLQPGDVRGLRDLNKIPIFNSDDLRKAIADVPPFGSHHPVSRDQLGAQPFKIQTSSGTTGIPRITLFDPITWEVQGIQAARAMYAQGARPGDIVQITYTNSLANAAWAAFNGLHHWLGCTPLTTGSGLVTSSERQLEYARMLGVTGWFARGEYLGRLAEIAAAQNFDLHELPTKFLHSYLGVDPEGHVRRRLEDAWGAPVYDNYGSHEIGLIAFECSAKSGKHISEDTVYIESVDVDTGDPRAIGDSGSLVVTSLHRSVPPFIRYDMRDVMVHFAREPCVCGLVTGKLSTFLGRADEMVKLRGTNVFPLACQNVVVRDERTNGNYICVLHYVGEGLGRREEMTIKVERRSLDISAESLQHDLSHAFHRDLGVRVGVEIVDPGSLNEQTRIGKEGKVKRLLDLRR